MPASNVPEIECQVQETAQMIADSGVAENCAVVVARFVANPASVSYTHLDVYKRQPSIFERQASAYFPSVSTHMDSYFG